MTVTPIPAPYVADVEATQVTEAIQEFTGRVAALLRSARRTSAPALGSWDLTEVAVHLSHAIDGVKAMVSGTESILADVWDLSGFMQMLVAGEQQRDLFLIADRIEASVAEFLAVVDAGRSGGGDPDRAWLVEGIRMPLPTLLCQVLNELVVHGHDIAKAEGAPWPIPRAHASMVLRGFVFPSLGALGRAMVDQDEAGGVRANFEVRLRGGGRAFFRFDDGDMAVTAVPPTRVDCHLSVDPTAFLLVAWGRSSQWSEMARGRLLAWGRRPWLGVQLRTLVRNP